MKIKRTLLVIGALSAIVSSTSLANAQTSLSITRVGGSVHIQQRVPCGGSVDVAPLIQDGHAEITAFPPRERQAIFELLTLDIFLTPFSVDQDCNGIHATVAFREIGLRLAGSIRFVGTPVEPAGEFAARIPKEQFLILESVLDNLPVPQPERKYQRPSQDVLIRVNPTAKTLQLDVVLSDNLRFRAGCVRGACLIDETDGGTQTSAITGQGPSCPVVGVEPLGADVTPPAVICSALDRAGNKFRVVASDDCGPVTISLGRYVLQDGEVIQLQETGQPGVRLIESSRTDGIRNFLAGPGEAAITATDAAGNVAVASCK
jgi:hypothetical protein